MLFRPEKITDELKILQLHDKDCGSEGIKICLLSQNIKTLELHLKNHKKDNDAIRILLMKRQALRTAMKHLKTSNLERYNLTIKTLSLKDIKI